MGTISARMFQRRPAINVNTDTSSELIDAKPIGTISACVFQRGPAINVKWTQALNQ